jgi:hypothetical protein
VEQQHVADMAVQQAALDAEAEAAAGMAQLAASPRAGASQAGPSGVSTVAAAGASFGHFPAAEVPAGPPMAGPGALQALGSALLALARRIPPEARRCHIIQYGVRCCFIAHVPEVGGLCCEAQPVILM